MKNTQLTIVGHHTNSERLKVFLLDQEQEQNIHVHFFCSVLYWKVLARAVKQEKEKGSKLEKKTTSICRFLNTYECTVMPKFANKSVQHNFAYVCRLHIG